MLVSIMIPTYNEKENIAILIPGIMNVINNNLLETEIVIVDGSSPDGTGNIASEMKKKYSNISAHHPFCPTRGIALLISAVFYRLKERCAIFICSGLNSWPLTSRYNHDLNSSRNKPLPFQDYFYRYYKTLPSLLNKKQCLKK